MPPIEPFLLRIDTEITQLYETYLHDDSEKTTQHRECRACPPAER